MEVSSGQDRRGCGPLGKIKAIAEYKGVSQSTVRRTLKSGELPYYRLPGGTILIAYRDVDTWLRKHRVEAGQSDLDDLLEEIVDGVLGG